MSKVNTVRQNLSEMDRLKTIKIDHHKMLIKVTVAILKLAEPYSKCCAILENGTAGAVHKLCIAKTGHF